MTEPDFTIRRTFKSRGEGLPTHVHAEAQLTYAASGMIQIHTERGVWLVPPQLAAWVPAHMPHRLDILTDAELWMVFWKPRSVGLETSSTPLDRAFVSRVTPLLAALLADAVVGDPGSDKAGLVTRLMLHELTAIDDAPTFLPLPASPVGQRVAECALSDHQNRLDLIELASRAATSVRTISRLFPAETGLSFKAWRQRARIVSAMERLGRGHEIARVATELGFRSTAAFSHAFRQVTAVRPRDFIGR